MQRPVVATGRASWGSRRVSAHARVILADNPSPLTYLGTNTWILADPGSPALPGHASDLVGFLMPSDASVMTGDMLFKQSSTLICWPDGSLAAYLESLERLRATVVERNVARLLTAHGPLIDHPLEAIDRVYRHRLDRLERVRAASEAGAGLDVDRIIEAVYQDVDARLDPAARINIQAQLEYLAQSGKLPS